MNCVSWDDAQYYIQWKKQQEPEYDFRLCTEAEWEYVARAGTSTKWACGDHESCLNAVAWYSHNNNPDGNKEVKTKNGDIWANWEKNLFGKPIYDMHGNVWEWVQDWYGTYPSGNISDPTGLTSGSGRVNRGDGFSNSAASLRSADRY